MFTLSFYGIMMNLVESDNYSLPLFLISLLTTIGIEVGFLLTYINEVTPLIYTIIHIPFAAYSLIYSASNSLIMASAGCSLIAGFICYTINLWDIWKREKMWDGIARKN